MLASAPACSMNHCSRPMGIPIRDSIKAGNALETKTRLGLDSERSWIVASEWNEFTWPGPDLRMARDGGEGSAVYGYLPAKLFAKVQAAFAERVKSGSSSSRHADRVIAGLPRRRRAAAR